MTMRQMLIKILKTIFSDMRQAAIPAIALLLVGGSAGLLLLSEKALDFVIQIANISTPLWATIALAILCCVYTYLKASQLQKQNHSLTASNVNTVLIEIGNFKWNVIISKDNEFEIHPIPYCKLHETRFIPFKEVYICPAYQLGCGSIIKKQDVKLQYDVAHSFIEHKVKNKCQQVVPSDAE